MQEENRELLSDFALRLANRASAKGLNQTEIASALGVESPRVSNWFQGRNFPRARQRVELARLLGVNSSWLYEGTGEMENFSSDPVVQEAVSQYGVTVREVPLISWTHAGQAATYEAMPRHWHGKVPASTRDPKAFALTIEGDCMEPKFMAGDIVVLEPSAVPRNGKPVVAKLDSDEVQLRIYTKLPSGMIKLASMRPEIYPTIDYEPTSFRWIFPVVGMYRPV